MPHIERTAHVGWDGNLARGRGGIDAGTGTFAGLPFSLPARIGPVEGKTSPEELLAAAHASCLAMALSAGLGRLGKPPRRLDIDASCTFDKVGDAWRVTTMQLDVVGQVPGLDAAGFAQAADAAKDGCPISNALKNNVQVRLTARLE